MQDYKKLVEALLERARRENEWYEHGGDIIKAAAAAIEALQAEVPKRGQWELIDGAEPMRWGCSRCKYMSWETSNYCPRCGAKMEVQE